MGQKKSDIFAQGFPARDVMEKLLRIIKNLVSLVTFMMLPLMTGGCFEHIAVGAVWTGGFLVYGPVGIAKAISNSAAQSASVREYLAQYPETNCPAEYMEVCRLATPGQVKAFKTAKVYELTIRLLQEHQGEIIKIL
jgi:hypothetical protein